MLGAVGGDRHVPESGPRVLRPPWYHPPSPSSPLPVPPPHPHCLRDSEGVWVPCFPTWAAGPVRWARLLSRAAGGPGGGLHEALHPREGTATVTLLR